MGVIVNTENPTGQSITLVVKRVGTIGHLLLGLEGGKLRPERRGRALVQILQIAFGNLLEIPRV